MIELTSGQQELLENAVKWFRDVERGNTSSYEHPQWYAYSGASGCGKTTVSKEIIKELNLSEKEYIGAAYTGKAVLQLQKNNVRAKTIHSLIYEPIVRYETDNNSGKKKLVIDFILKNKLSDDLRLIIIDEATMVNNTMVDELLSFNIPVIFMGDMNQLPPVFGVSSIMENPNFTLTQIMRQKENDPIVQLSQLVLKDLPILEGQYGLSKVTRDFDFNDIKLYDQVLCTNNKFRYELNTLIRSKILNRKNNEPCLYDKVICRQNNWGKCVDDYYLVNGLSGIITDIDRSTLSKGYYTINFKPDFMDKEFYHLHMDSKYIKANIDEQQKMMRLKNEKFEYSYAITVHLSQGSEYPNVLFFDSFFHDKDLTKKARYTAITRAQESITIVRMR